MNGHRAKSIRRAVYGDHSSNAVNRQYTVRDLGDRIIRWLTSKGEKRQFHRRTLIVTSAGLRRQYQQAKVDYKHSRVMPTVTTTTV